MHHICKLLAVGLVLAVCLSFASCALFGKPQKEEEPTTLATPTLTTPEETTTETTTEETTPGETTTVETTTEETSTTEPEPDFSNTPDPDGTKRY